MKLFYIDESGTGLKDKQSPFFVLSAIAIPTKQWRDLDRQLTILKRQLVSWAKPEDFELKGRSLQRGDGVFTNMNWDARLTALTKIAELIARFRFTILAVQVAKRDLPEYIATPNDLYRIAFWRLLDEIEHLLEAQGEQGEQEGLLMLDARSDLHSSVQDRRLLDVYRDWLASKGGNSRLVELPWFGFSAFYAGLQLADVVAYLIDRIHNDELQGKRSEALRVSFARFQSQVRVIKIP